MRPGQGSIISTRLGLEPGLQVEADRDFQTVVGFQILQVEREIYLFFLWDVWDSLAVFHYSSLWHFQNFSTSTPWLPQAHSMFTHRNPCIKTKKRSNCLDNIDKVNRRPLIKEGRKLNSSFIFLSENPKFFPPSCQNLLRTSSCTIPAERTQWQVPEL
jgi:hypothetical protein